MTKQERRILQKVVRLLMSDSNSFDDALELLLPMAGMSRPAIKMLRGVARMTRPVKKRKQNPPPDIIYAVYPVLKDKLTASR